MDSINDYRVLLTMRVEGPATREGRIALANLALLASNLQTSLNRVTRVLTAERGLARREARIAQLQCRLQVIEAKPGSFQLSLTPTPMDVDARGDLGTDALRTLLTGLESLRAGTEPVLPRGWDTVALKGWAKIGKLLEQGVSGIDLTLVTPEGRLAARFDNQSWRNIRAVIDGPEREPVLAAMRATEQKPVQAQSFWEGLPVDKLAERQAVYPVQRLESLFGDFWPAEENLDDFIGEIYSRRREERGRWG